MSKIMELADAYASGLENYARGDKYDIRLRDALAAEVEKLEADVDAKADIAHRALDERDALREKLAAVEKDDRRNQKLLYGFMLDWNAIGPLDAAANLARGIKEAAMESTK